MLEIKSDMLISSLYDYFRFKRQMICTDEFAPYWANYRADFVALNEKGFLYEIEVKVSKQDLIINETKKNKWDFLPFGREVINTSYGEKLLVEDLKKKENFNKKIQMYEPNYFYYCVPDYLEETAKNFIKEFNPNFGLIIFNTEKANNTLEIKNKINFNADLLRVAKKPKKLNKFPERKVKK